MLEKFDPMAGDEAAILRSKKKKALESITERMLHMDEEVTRVPYEYHGAYPWNTTTTTGTGWLTPQTTSSHYTRPYPTGGN